MVLLVMSGLAQAVTFSSGTELTSTALNINKAVWNQPGASVTLFLDSANFSNLFNNASSDARPVFVSMCGSGSLQVGLAAQENGQICVATYVIAGGQVSANLNSLYFETTTQSDLTSIDWKTVKASALTMALDSSIGTTWTLSVLHHNNTYTELHATYSAAAWWSMGDVATIYIPDSDSSFRPVEKAYAFDGYITGENAIELNHSAIAANIPEPTTATLSLLTLAGLAARRRRK